MLSLGNNVAAARSYILKVSLEQRTATLRKAVASVFVAIQGTKLMGAGWAPKAIKAKILNRKVI